MNTAAQPETIGSFRVLSKLGQGGMGTVFRAVHGTLERPVALKVLPPEFSNNPEYVMRFLREARTIATLRHENVVQVYDAGEVSGQYFIAMELVDGLNLLKYTEEKGKISEKEGLDLLLQAARGLAAAHAKGLVHRDVKPENMLLGKDGVLRIVDFGLVMESASTTQLTATGACLGTPMYMSPEQADGEQADPRTDLYSLGVSFYRVFTGQAPFQSPTVMNLLFKHKFEAPPNPKQLRADLSDDVAHLLLHLMIKRREDRPQSAQAIIDMIEGIKHGKAVPAPPVFVPPSGPGASAPAAAWGGPSQNLSTPSMVLRRSKLVPLAAAGALLLAIVLFAALFIGGKTTPHAGSERPWAGAGKGGLLERGEAAFQGQSYSDALELYREALAESPQDVSIKEKIARTERAIRYQDLIRKAETLESQGELLDAAARYAEAAALDETSFARDRASRIREKVAQTSTMDRDKRQKECDRLSKLARESESASKYDIAAEHYSQAAALAEGATKNAFADKSRDCRRQDFMAQAVAAEGRNDLNLAVAMYQRAQNIKNDPLVAEKIGRLQKQMHEVANNAETDRLFAEAMQAGQRALEAGNYKEARVQFGVAMGLKLDATEPTEKIKEVARLEAAAAAHPGLNSSASSAALSKAETLIRTGKDDDPALSALVTALRADANNVELRNMKKGLEQLQACGSIYSELTQVIEEGLRLTRDMRDLSDDSSSKDLRTRLQTLENQFGERSRRVRGLLLDHNYDGVKLAMGSARKDAKTLAEELSGAASGCEAKAEKAGDKVSVKDPFGIVKIDVGGESEKATKYRRIGEAFKTLANRAKALKE